MNINYDFDEASGAYILTGLTHTEELTKICDKPLNITYETGIGWGSRNYLEYNYGGRESGFSDYYFKVATDYALTDNVKLGAHLTWSNLCKDVGGIRSSNPENSNIWGGLSLSYAY